MAILPWFTRLFFLILNVFIGVLQGIIYSEMCGSVFENKDGKYNPLKPCFAESLESQIQDVKMAQNVIKQAKK